MKNKMHDIGKDKPESAQAKKISRKQALRKAGFVALSAVTMMMLVGSPQTAHAGSTAPPNPNPWGV